MPPRTLTLRGIPSAVLDKLRARARTNHRSLNAELLLLLKDTVSAPPEKRTGAVRAAAPRRYGPSGPSGSVLDQVDHPALADLCRRHHIRWLAVFGSQAAGTARPGSDVDVVVDFEPEMTPGFGIVRVAEELAPVLGGLRVDLVTRAGLRPPFREHVLATAIPLYGS